MALVHWQNDLQTERLVLYAAYTCLPNVVMFGNDTLYMY